ncbi:MAG: hypothetical protein Q9221_001776 [Calogaya cf. arnoldii]
MKAIAISTTLALLTSMVAAAPAPVPASASGIQIRFIGAADGQFTQGFPANGVTIGIHNPLSISKIYKSGGVTCQFNGIDRGITVVPAGQTVDVGPPQTQISGYCN